MSAEPTYNRPVAATLIVRLANGEEFEAKPEDFAKFGYVPRDNVLTLWRAFVESATGSDLLSENSVLNPLWVVLHQVLHNPGSLSDGSMGNTKADIQGMDRSLRESRGTARDF